MKDYKKKEILRSVTTRTDTDVVCKVSPFCTYSLPVDRFVVAIFCQHIKSCHGNAYKALFHERNWKEDKRPCLMDKLSSCMKRDEHKGGFRCDGTEYCSYFQPYDRFNEKNFARHLGYYHQDTYKDMDIGYFLRKERKFDPAGEDEDEDEAQERNENGDVVVSVEVRRYKLLTGLFRMMTCHGIKFEAFAALTAILGVHLESLDVTMDEDKAREHVISIAERVQWMIEDELEGRMIALQLHGKSCINQCDTVRCEVRVTCTYRQDNCTLAKRLLGVIQLSEDCDKDYLEEELEKIKNKYVIEAWQIYSVTVDYGIVTLDSDLKEEESFNIIPQWRRGMDEEEIKETMEQYAVSQKADGKLLQCCRHVISETATDAIQDFGDLIRDITRMVTEFRQKDNRNYFESAQERYPPKPDRKNWGIGTYLMLRVLKEKRPFFEKFTAEKSTYDLKPHWDFIEEFVAAFEPLYICAVHVGDCPLSDFHLQWTIAYGKIKSLAEENRFRAKLLAAMDARKKSFDDSIRHAAALYMDPRFNFKGSTLFDAAKKEEIVSFLLSIHGENKSDNDSSEDDCSMASETETSKEAALPTPPKATVFNADDYFTAMFVEPPSSSSAAKSSMEQAIREIANQDRCSATDPEFNIVRYWRNKKLNDPRLWALAQTVLAPVTTTCYERIEQDEYYRTDGLYDGDDESDDDEDDTYESQKKKDKEKWCVLYIKKNQSFLNKAIAQEFNTDPDEVDSDASDD